MVNDCFDSDSILAWCDYIAQQHVTAKNTDAIRVTDIATKLDLVSFPAKVVTVAGTNGKGSTVCYLQHIYHCAGYNVGSFTSPDLLKVNERIKLNGTDVSDEELISAFRRVEVERDGMPLSYFEFLTLAALIIFSSYVLDVILLEVGLGGRLDPVNVVDSDLAVISSIGLDHTEWLGTTRNAIAREKAGIFRGGCKAVITEMDVPQGLFQIADEKSTELFMLNRDFKFISHSDWWQYISKYQVLSLPVPQLRLDHAATSIFVSELLQDDLPILPIHIEKAMFKVTLPGRFELVEADPLIIFDVAHNSQSAQFLAKQLRSAKLPQKLVALVGMRRDKDYQACLKPLLGLFDYWYAVCLENEGFVNSENIMHYLRDQGDNHCYHYMSLELALEALYSNIERPNNSAVVVFGSFTLVREAKRYLGFD